MKILLVSTEFPPSARSGGIGVYTEELALGLVGAGIQVVVLTSVSRGFRNLVEVRDGIVIHRLCFPDYFVGRDAFSRMVNRVLSYGFYNLWRIRLSSWVNKLHKMYRFDIVEFPEYGNESKYWLLVKTIPTVIRFHGPSSLDRFRGELMPLNNRQKDELEYLYKADGLSFVSQAMKSLVEKNYTYVNEKTNSRVILNSVAIPNLIKSVRASGSDSKIRIVGAGSIGRIKGWDLLFYACKRLVDEGLDIELLLFGRLADLGKFFVDQSRNSKWIKIMGSVDRRVLFESYASADICCFPSWFEPSGLTVFEAMGAGRIVIASSIGGAPEIVEDGVNGFLFDPREGERRLYEIIKVIVNLDYLKRRKIEDIARKTIVEKFSKQLFVDNTIRFYENIKSETC